ncbi:translocation and assembly module lipoprotein TamL [Taibaiella koreensis]|uniref:translocation and assembly module lipoprotein TamL n=1 Tax=Taibaiella koreensis TaxID=1268548 RepID=UPI000E59C19B|nr:BamA/TamA family outer membrane protein [Taibaiella koreensis]
MKLFHAFFLLAAIALLPACSSTKYLKDDQYLLRNVNIKLSTDRTFSEKGALSDQLYSLMPQRPNSYLFGIFPVKLWLYNIRYKKYQQDTANFQLTSKVVEKPSLLDTAMILRARKNMKDFLRNSGYFYASVSDTVKIKGKKAYITYKVATGSEYLIDEVTYDIADEGIAKLIPKLNEGSLLNKNKAYSNTLTGAERNRLTNVIRNYGYYRFSADNIDFELDTLDKSYFRNLENPFESAINFITLKKQKKKPTLNVKVIVHPTDDSLEFKPFTFKNVIVIPDYVDTNDLRNTALTEKEVNGLTFRYRERYVRTGILDKKIFIRPGNLYSQADYNQTLRQLNDLGIFQYVRMFIFANRQDSLNRTLSCYILMNKNKKYDFGTNVEVSGGDLYAIGTAANVSVTDKNFLKGANELTTTVSYGIELGQNKNLDVPYPKQFYLFSQNIGINFRLTFPKFILPVNQNKFSQSSVPRTVLTAGINSLDRYQYFNLVSVNASYGYIWKESAIKTWTVKPIFVNTLHLRNISDTFQTRIDNIPAIRNSYQETFVEGESVEYVINTEGQHRWRYAYLKLGGEEAGALLSGIKGIGDAIGSPFSFTHARYFRLDFDARQYLLRRNSSLAMRFYGGIGIPYGGSTILPYIKQYFVGGAYSIRGWRPRVLGPGSYYDSVRQNSSDNLFIDQAGDIKLEFNAEYRFAMIKLFSGAISLNGAVFTDMGNIWLARKDDKLPGANFEFKNLYQDIAVSSGAGVRLDLGGFLVVRFDWAIPLKKPYINSNSGWVLKDIDLGDPDWRQKNVNLNIAIGYPF